MSKALTGRFDTNGLKPGDKVKIISKEKLHIGPNIKVVKIYTLTGYNGNPVIEDGDNLWNGYSLTYEKVEDVIYEDDWVLVTKGVTVPEDADVSLSQAGHVVAFRPVKKPKIVEHVRYAGNDLENDGTRSYQSSTFPHKVVFTITDGILTDVRLEK